MSLIADLIPPEYVWVDLKTTFGGPKAAFIDVGLLLIVVCLVGYIIKRQVDYYYVKADSSAKAPLTVLTETQADLSDCQETNKTILRELETVKQERLVERNQDDERLDAQEATIHQLRKEVYDLQAIVLKLTRELDEAMNTIRGLQTLERRILVSDDTAGPMRRKLEKLQS